ncbi:MAG: CCA tRNA nucleotidyltransferase [Chloroflexi bacterium]|nr:CCA tRNA nucleotidyltransferase [Chloroflexota bacterium]
MMASILDRKLHNTELLAPERLDLLFRVANQAEKLGMNIYLVGGIIRDLLLDRRVEEMDVVVEGDAGKLGLRLHNEHGGKLTRHHRFKTATWFYSESGALDLVTARSETYPTPGALPVIETASILDDLRRRDFTINAMAAKVEKEQPGELLDIFNGRSDLDRKIIRILHRRSFVDDPTRMLRALRYEQRYGFRIDDGTSECMNSEALKILSGMSGERIRYEFESILREKHPAGMMRRAQELGLLRAFNPELPAFNPSYELLLESVPPIEFGISNEPLALGMAIWLADVSPQQIRQIARRLDFPRRLSIVCLSAAEIRSWLPGKSQDLKPSQWTENLEKHPPFAIYVTWLLSQAAPLRDYLVNWRNIRPHATGETLIALGLPPGPQYKRLISRLRRAWLDGEIHSEQEERELLHKLMDQG